MLYFHCSFECFSIAIPANDPNFRDPTRKCMHVVRSDAAPPLDCSVGKDGYTYWRIALKGYHFQTRHSTYVFIWMIVINLPNKYISDMQVSVNNKIRGLPTLMEL